MHIIKHCAVSVSRYKEQHLTTPHAGSTAAARACQVLQEQPAKRLPAKQPRKGMVGNMRAGVICDIVIICMNFRWSTRGKVNSK